MRCKRCGTKFDVLDHLCTGCGKSIIALREDNEIIYNDEELSQVEIYKMNKQNEVPKEKIVEEVKEPLDVFGDALFSMENKLVDETELTNIDTTNESQNLISESEAIEILDDIEQIEIINNDNQTDEVIFKDSPFKEETINAEKIITNNISDETEIIEFNDSNIEQINTETTDLKEAEVIPTEIKTSKKTKKKKMMIIILVIIAIVLSLLAGIIFYFYNMTSPKKIFTTIVDKISFNDISVNNVRSELTLSLNTETNDEIANLINNLKLNMTSHISNNSYYVKLNPTYKNQNLIDADIYLDNNRTYLYLNEIYDKYIDIGTSSVEINDQEFEQLEIYLSELKKEIKNILNSKYLSRETEKIEINGKKKTYLKSVFELNQANSKELFNNLKNNQKFVDSLAKLNNMSIDEVKQELENSSLNTNDELKIVLYIDLISRDIAKADISIISSDEDFIVTLINNNASFDFELKSSENDTTISGNFKLEKKDLLNNYIISLKSNDGGNLTFKISSKIEKNKELVLPNFNNTISINDINEEDYEQIMNNIIENDAIKEFAEIILRYTFGDMFDEIFKDMFENPNLDENREE